MIMKGFYFYLCEVSGWVNYSTRSMIFFMRRSHDAGRTDRHLFDGAQKKHNVYDHHSNDGKMRSIK